MKYLLASVILFSGTFAFADDYGYAPFKNGQLFEASELTWAHTLTGATCDIRIPQMLKVTGNQKNQGDLDDVFFQVDNPEKARPGECVDGEKVVLNIIQSDQLREGSKSRAQIQNEFDRIITGKSTVQSYQGLSVGDALEVSSWTWAILSAPTQNRTQSFRETDLCRIREDHKIIVLGFNPAQKLSYFKYEGDLDASFSDCPSGAIFQVKGTVQ